MFDPYHKWLGIPPGQRPVTFYQLLAIAPEEQDREVIEEAAIRQTTHLRTYQTGAYAQECARLLSEIAQARNTLVDLVKRREYDARLARKSAVKTVPVPASPPPARRAPVLKIAAEPQEEEPTEAIVALPLTARKSRKSSWLPFGIALGVALVILGTVLAVIFLNSSPEPASAKDSKLAAADTAKGSTVKSEAMLPVTHSEEEDKTKPAKPAKPLRAEDEEPTKPIQPKPPVRVDDETPSKPAISKPPVPVAVQPRLPKKTPVPDLESQAKSEKEVKELYKAEYGKTKTADLKKLAAILLKQGVETKDNASDRYVLLREARDLAARAGEFETALRAIEEMASDFAVSASDLKARALARAGEAALTPEAGKVLAEAAFGLIDEAIAADEFDAALRLAAVASSVARKASWGAFAAKAEARQKELKALQQDFQQVKEAADKLRQTPDDAEANLTMGRYFCLVKGAWDKGLPMLARGSDPALQALAAKEASRSADPDALIELGDGWTEQAGKEKGLAKTQMLLRAKSNYEQALPELKGLTKNKIELKIQEFAKSTGETARPALTGLAGLTPGSFSLATRSGPVREQLLLDGGGNARSEAAVAQGLTWLARHQKPDGHWTLDGYDTGLGRGGLEIGGTALALLPFLGTGETSRRGAHAKVVDKGLKYLIRRQAADGSFKPNATYEHALATIALGEAAVLTGDALYKKHAQSAVNYIVKGQHAGGGWRYGPNQPGDLSATGWQYSALKTGQLAGLTVPRTTFQGISRFLDSVQGQDGSLYRYMPNEGQYVAGTTAIGLLVRQHQGWGPSHPGLAGGVAELLKPDNLPRAQNKNCYYYYYATQVLRHHGGKKWEMWNPRMRELLLDTQERGEQTERANLKGSWAPQGDRYGGEGGRLMVTSLSLLTLEVYYRYVPFYLREQDRPKD